MSFVELPWYDLPELRSATDGWWAGIARHLRDVGVVDVPAQLIRDGHAGVRWRQPDLLLSQACGYDLLYDAADDIVPIATPCYAAEGCEGPRYRSYVVVRADRPWRQIEELRGRRLAINEPSSHSGNNALRPHVAALHIDGVFFATVTETGSHLESLAALHADTVEVACIDAVVLALLRRIRSPLVLGLRALACTVPALAPPYVTSRRSSQQLVQQLRQALLRAVADPDLAGVREALLLRDFAVFPAASYAELEDFEQSALQSGYFELPAPSRSPLGLLGTTNEPRDPGPRGSCAGG